MDILACYVHMTSSMGGGSNSNEETAQRSEDFREKRSRSIFQKSKLSIRLVETIVES